ncbi:MAG: 16S rRNA processing protein RimM [Anaerolineae bacterium UTCFX2]|nr:ribosome maturation factor RimM [Anaerolineales bacterium]OQY89279.1 MAG: 16S rRNA processing protein RimM [Anaerolineae bacterium UTCFX2]
MPRNKRLLEFSQPAGSPPSGEPVFLAVGRLLSPHGLNGEIQMEILSDFPERLKPGRMLYLGDDRLPLEVRGRRGHSRGFLIAFTGYDNPESVKEMRGQYLYTQADDLPELPKGEFYHHQILGLRVKSDAGQELGTVVGILETGANDVFVVQSQDGSEILLPNIRSIVLEIDPDRHEMTVHLLPGLVPEKPAN